MSSSFKIDFTSTDVTAEAGAGTYAPIPSGEYTLAITKTDMREVKSGSNQGKPMMNVEFTVQDEGDYYGRKLWANIMLFSTANNFFISQFLKAQGVEVTEGEMNVPSHVFDDGNQLVGVVRKVRDKYADEQEPETAPHYKNEIKGFKALDNGGDSAATTGGKGTKKNPLAP